MDILDAGFSCKDLSSLNNDHVAWTGYIINMLRLVNSEMQLPPGKEDDVEGTTLPTLLGCLRCVFACRAVLVWLENVEGVKQLWDEIHRLMRLMGYCGCMTTTEATDYGHVATRLRKKLLFSRSDTMPGFKLTCKWLRNDFEEVWADRISSVMRMLKLKEDMQAIN